MPRIIKSPYLIGGIIVFLILFGVLLFGVQATLGESLAASAALAVIGVVGLLWKEHVGDFRAEQKSGHSKKYHR